MSFYIDQNLVSVLHRPDDIQNRKFCSKLINVSVMPGTSHQRNRKLKCGAQSCSKLTGLFQKSRPDDQCSTNKSFDDVGRKNMLEVSDEQK